MFICGQNFNFSVMNANDLDRFDDAQEKMQARNAAETERFQRGGIRLGDHVRAQTRIAMDCIDEILGAGASARLGLDENNMAPVYDVIEELGNAFQAEQQRYAAKPAQPMNRAQRRAAAKQHKQKPVSRSEGFHPQVANSPAQPAAIPYEQWGTMTPHDAAELRGIDKAARRKQLLAELSALENG